MEAAMRTSHLIPHLLRRAVFAAPLAVSACAGSDDDGDDTDDTEAVETDDTETEAPGTASVRFIHASANAPSVSVWSDGAELAESASFGSASGFVDVPAGALVVDLCGPSVPSCDAPLGSVELEVEEGATYSVIALGDFERAGSDGFGLLLSEHGFGTPESGEALVRVIHGSPDAPAVGLDVGADDPESPEFASFPPLGDSGPAGVAFPAGEAWRLGITSPNGSPPLTSFSAPALEEGDTVYLIAVGFAAAKSYWDTSLSLLAVSQDGSTSLVRQDPRLVLLHASTNVSDVDVFASDSLLAADLGFGGTASVRVPPGTYDVDLFPANPDSNVRPTLDPVFSKTVTVEAGAEYVAVASGVLFTGDVGFLSPEVTAFDVFLYPLAFSPDDVDDAQVVVAHHEPALPSVDVGPYDDTDCTIDPVVSGLDYGTASDVLVLDEGSLDLGASLPGDPRGIVFFGDVSLEVGQQIFAVVHGSQVSLTGASVALPSRVTAIDTAPVLSAPWSAGAITASTPTCPVPASAP
jgi:hypothetical protein